MFLRDMELMASIGVLPHEQRGRQRVRINVDMAVLDDLGTEPADADELSRVVDYGEVANGIRALVGGDHVNLVETLAERIAGLCLVDERVLSARVRVEKLDIFNDMVAVGVEVQRGADDARASHALTEASQFQRSPGVMRNRTGPGQAARSRHDPVDPH